MRPAHHWDKAVAAVVFGACAWNLAGVGRLLGGRALPSDLEETVNVVTDALAARTPADAGYLYASDPPDYSGDAAAALDCNGCAGVELPTAAPHLIYPVAPKPRSGYIDVYLVKPSFNPPVVEGVEAAQGKVELTVAQNPEDMYVRILKFELFRREEGGAYGEPLAVLEPGADARATFRDDKVEPKRRYAYKARAIGVANVTESPPEEPRRPNAPLPGRRVERPKKRRKVVRPQNVDEVRIGEATAWLTPFSSEAHARTPSDIELELVGIVGEPPDWSARIRIAQWHAGFETWDEGTFSIEEGEAIGGVRIVKRPRGQEKVEFDSRHVLVKIERVKRIIETDVPVPLTDGTRKVRIEINVPRITVREASGAEYFICPKKWAEKTSPEAPEAEGTAVTRRRSARPRP